MTFPTLHYNSNRNEIVDSRGKLIANLTRNRFAFDKKTQLSFGVIFSNAPRLGACLLQLWNAHNAFMATIQDDSVSEEVADEAAVRLARAMNKAGYALKDIGVLCEVELEPDKNKDQVQQPEPDSPEPPT